jgi:dTDP-4-amino-4,6-dideoxygalactose transaminase
LKLQSLDKNNAKRRKIAELYRKRLAGIGDLALPTAPDNEEAHVWHLFVVKTKERERLRQYLQAEGIHTLCHYPVPPFSQRAYTELNIRPEDYPVSSNIHSTCLSLPISATHTRREIESVCSIIKRYFNQI